MDGNNNVKLGSSIIIVKKDRDLEKETKETNTKVNNYCVGKRFIFANNANIKINCLNNSNSHLSSSKWRVTVSGELMFLESYCICDVTNTVTLHL